MSTLVAMLNLVVLVLMIAGIRSWQRRHGRLSPARLALFVAGFGTIFIVTSVHPIYLNTHSVAALILELAMLVLWWSLGLVWVRWLIRKFYNRN